MANEFNRARSLLCSILRESGYKIRGDIYSERKTIISKDGSRVGRLAKLKNRLSIVVYSSSLGKEASSQRIFREFLEQNDLPYQPHMYNAQGKRISFRSTQRAS